MASVYKEERVRSVAMYTASPELQHAIARLLDGSFQPRVTKKREPRQLEKESVIP